MKKRKGEEWGGSLDQGIRKRYGGGGEGDNTQRTEHFRHTHTHILYLNSGNIEIVP